MFLGYVAFFPSIFIPTFAYFSCVSGRPSRKGGNIFFFSFLTLGFCIVFVFISLLLYTIKSRLQVTTKCSSRHFGSFGPGHCSNVEDAIVNESDPFV